MFERYNVYHGENLIAVIHAEDAQGAIRLACAKTDGHKAERCTAQVATQKAEHDVRMEES